MELRVSIDGANDVLRQLRQVGPDAQEALSERAYGIARDLVEKMQGTARALGRQDARAASTVTATKAGLFPIISAAPTGRARGLLWASNFGMKRKSGWYAKVRYFDSAGRQFREWNGGAGHADYWFYSTADREQSWIAGEWSKAADDVVRAWSA